VDSDEEMDKVESGGATQCGVNAIQDHRLSTGGILEYLVNWYGYDDTYNTWVTIFDIIPGVSVLEEYDAEHGVHIDEGRRLVQIFYKFLCG